MDADALRVLVHDRWDGWHSAEVRANDIEDVHWLKPAGAAHELLHGFIRCRDIVSGSIPHDCEGSAAHWLRVCILKRHTLGSTYAALARGAGTTRHHGPRDDAKPAAEPDIGPAPFPGRWLERGRFRSLLRVR
jgi:hypothetical protein